MRFRGFTAGLLAVAVVLAGSFTLAPSALAQDDDIEVRGKRVTIEVDDDGHVIIDGKRLSDDDGPVILHVRPDDGQVEVEAVGPRRRHIVAHRRPHGDRERYVFRSDNHWRHPLVDDFDFEFEMPPMPDVGPLMERFKVGIGDPLRESLEEHREVAGLEKESRDIARRARRADGAERGELETELRAQLNEIFDKKVELRQERIRSIEEKLADEREKLDRRRAARDEMIERRLRTLMGEDDILDW